MKKTTNTTIQHIRQSIIQKKNSNRRIKNESQMITLMGITLALTVFIISALPSELSDLGNVVPKARSSSLEYEYIHLKDTFNQAINQYLLNYSFLEEINKTYPPGNPTMLYIGNDGKYTVRYNIEPAIQNIAHQLYLIELQYNKIFTASYPSSPQLTFSHTTSEGHVYVVYVSLSLQDEYCKISQEVNCSVICNEYYFS